MSDGFRNAPGANGLTGRERECAVLDRLVDAVRDGDSRALVIRGQAGVGKTSLLDHLTENAAGCRILRTVGVQSEMELAYASPHQLLAPAMNHLERLPAPQQDALRIAIGLSAARRRTGSWSRSPCSGCSPRRPPARR